MKAYELLYFVAPSADDKIKNAASKRVNDVIKKINGKIDEVDEMGKKSLAYEINGLNEGDYTLIDFHIDPAQVAELDRVLRITDEVQRHMIVRRTDRD